MNKKGFTLIEVTAVIAIIALLIAFATPNLRKTQKRILQRDYDSICSQVSDAAIEWASDNLNQIPKEVSNPYNNEKSLTADCAHPTIQHLIDSGYLPGTKKGRQELVDPRNNKSINYKLVCIRYDSNDLLNRKIIAYVVEE